MSLWEGSTSRLIPDEGFVEKFGTDDFATAFARIECHYFVKKGFFPSDNFLLDQVHKLNGIPGTIIQGRYDVVCPAESAWSLHKKWENSNLIIVPDAGHAASEKGITSALIEATDQTDITQRLNSKPLFNFTLMIS